MRKGTDLPWAKLTDDDVKLILSCVEERKRLRAQASELSAKSLAEKFGVHQRTIEKVISGESWGHVFQ